MPKSRRLTTWRARIGPWPAPSSAFNLWNGPLKMFRANYSVQRANWPNSIRPSWGFSLEGEDFQSEEGECQVDQADRLQPAGRYSQGLRYDPGGREGEGQARHHHHQQADRVKRDWQERPSSSRRWFVSEARGIGERGSKFEGQARWSSRSSNLTMSWRRRWSEQNMTGFAGSWSNFDWREMHSLQCPEVLRHHQFCDRLRLTALFTPKGCLHHQDLCHN